ncbi:MAG: hypothetical protein AB7E77_11290 [Desulfobulbus sp.]
MRGRAQTCTVKDGRIRVTCSRCTKSRYVAVPGGLRKKNVRCPCGQSTMYTLNHRAAARESTWGKAFVLLPNGRECPVYLCDISPGGLGFTLPPQYTRTLATAHDLRIKYRSGTGNTMLRRIRITSLVNNRAGAAFLDGKPPSF